jgi:HlyD family secretion protein
MRAWTVMVALCMSVFAAGCRGEPQPDAYGNVEATEVVVSSEVGGQLQTFTVEEGQTLAAGEPVGTVDPTALTLQRDQAAAQRDATSSRAGEIISQVQMLMAQRDALESQRAAAVAQRRVLQSQHDVARRHHERMQRLFAQQAATAQQLDQAERDLRTLDEQLDVQARRIAVERGQVQAADARVNTARQDVRTSAARLSQLADRLQDADVKNPRAGTVLTTFVEEGELVQPGQRLYTIADLQHVDVRAYIDETQLASVRTGQPATVTFDTGPDRRGTLEGIVTWIASQAEFTPTPIQTREERTGLVYAVKIRVPNGEGLLKIGMPVDVVFQQAPQ